MLTTSGKASGHVPAWKKLGLKLKFAKDLPEPTEDVNHAPIHTANGKKRKHLDEEVTGDGTGIGSTNGVSKKVKKHKSKSKTHGDQIDGPEHSQNPTTQIPPVEKNLVKQKSVSFTPETKTEDGEGVKQLYTAWLEKQKADDPSFDLSKISPALRSVKSAVIDEQELAVLTDPTSKPSQKNTRKRLREEWESKHGRKKKDSKPAPEATDTSPNQTTLNYLQTYHATPDHWKFSKVQQNNLLKHLYSPTYIPPSYDPALLSYLRGLKGWARSRIRTEALAVRKEDDVWLDSEPTSEQKMENETSAQCLKRRKRDYDIAVAHMKEQLRQREYEREDREWELIGDKDDWDRHVRKRRRAELVLWGVGEEEDVKQDAMRPKIVTKQAILGNSRPSDGAPVTIQSRGMGGVEQISAGGIAKDSRAKKIRFDEDNHEGNNVVDQRPKSNGLPAATNGNVATPADGAKRNRRRKTKGRVKTGVPDDDSSSDEDSSSSDEDNEKAQMAQAKPKALRKVSEIVISSDDSSDSDSDSADEGSDSE